MANQRTAQLSRSITLWPLAFYGLGVIVGAGIYVAIGDVIARAGERAPFSFLLAGVVALLTGLCYAELAGRFPEAAGAASYVQRAFRSDRLSQIVGLMTTVAVAISAASIAGGASRYVLVLIPVREWMVVTVLAAAFTAIAISGIRSSVALAATVGGIEIAGLLAAIAAGLLSARQVSFWSMTPNSLADWKGTIAGAFSAFFAFIGFETMANLGEEVKDPSRTLPLGILIAVLSSILLYVSVAAAAVLSGSAGDLPLLNLFEGRATQHFALVAAVAISNGVLVEIVMLARLFYGMSSNGQLPAFLGRVNARTQTPVLATVAAGAIILLTALAVPFREASVAGERSEPVDFSRGRSRPSDSTARFDSERACIQNAAFGAASSRGTRNRSACKRAAGVKAASCLEGSRAPCEDAACPPD
jgi:APA family basic amino acid/polyamine antiporter